MRTLCAILLAIILAPAGTLRAQPSAVDWTALVPGLWQMQPTGDILGRAIAVAPGDSNRLAYCGHDGIWRSLDGGQSWSRVSVDGVAALATAASNPLAPRPGTAPRCAAMALDLHDPAALYATFWTLRAPQDAAPPTYAIGYYTTDAGQTWQPAPVPEGFGADQFGGFRADVDGVRALYSAGSGLSPAGNATVAPVTPPAVELTTDAGQTWQIVPFVCPTVGPCMQWGAAPSQLTTCAMHGFPQPLLASPDGGQSWLIPLGARGANACEPNELIALTDTTGLLLAPGPNEIDPDPVTSPLRISAGGGLTWTPADLPDLPGVRQLELLPDGRLLGLALPGATWSWWLLAPDALSWCPLPDGLFPAFPTPLTIAAAQVWWLNQDGAPTAVPLTDISCG